MAETYHPIPGDIRIQEVHPDRFSIRFYDGAKWHLEGCMSAQEVQRRPAYRRLMDESECKGKRRQYYRSQE